jgi:outer membrane protein assembly factor BamE (lipoprotein component of BamABCDE complex)
MGKNFDSSQVTQITKGKTTANDLVAMFGNPFSKKPESEDMERWQYNYVTTVLRIHATGTVGGATATGEKTGTQKSLNLLVNKDGIVVNFTFVEGAVSPLTLTNKNGLVEGRQGKDFDGSMIGQIAKGKTTRDDLITIFGLPQAKEPEANDAERWLYEYLTVKKKGRDTTVYKKDLNILLDKGNIVQNYTTNEGPADKESSSTTLF